MDQGKSNYRREAMQRRMPGALARKIVQHCTEPAAVCVQVRLCSAGFGSVPILVNNERRFVPFEESSRSRPRYGIQVAALSRSGAARNWATGRRLGLESGSRMAIGLNFTNSTGIPRRTHEDTTFRCSRFWKVQQSNCLGSCTL